MTDNHKLRRQNGMVAGVCGGLGTFFGLRGCFESYVYLRVVQLTGPQPGYVPDGAA